MPKLATIPDPNAGTYGLIPCPDPRGTGEETLAIVQHGPDGTPLRTGMYVQSQNGNAAGQDRFLFLPHDAGVVMATDGPRVALAAP